MVSFPFPASYSDYKGIERRKQRRFISKDIPAFPTSNQKKGIPITPVFRDQLAETFITLMPRLRRYALSLARRADLADDLVQLTAERAFAQADGPDASMRLEPWLFRILRNAFIDMTRRTRTRGIEADVHDNPDLLSFDGAADTETRLMATRALEAVDRLPEDQRDVMMLVCVEELSYAEAAGVLEVPIGTVMSRLSRARLAIAREMGIK